MRLRGFLRSEDTSGGRRGVDTDRRGGRPNAPTAPLETCELCRVPLLERHRHLLESDTRRVVCSCDPCALRFHDVLDGRYKLIPRDARALPDFQISDLQWAAFSIPIDLAFLFRDSANDRRVALYPSPAGVTESDVAIDAWQTLLEANPILDSLRDDVEALLVNRLDDEPLAFLAPIDTCYELAGLIRVHWRGFTGGEEVWEHVNAFFDRLRRTARHA